MRLVAVAVVVCALGSVSSAGAFRGGTIGWQVRDLAAPHTVEVTITTFWDEPTSENTSMDVDFGDGTSSGPLTSTVIYTGSTQARGEGFTIRRLATTHTYATDGAYTAVIAGCCRHATTNAAATDPYRIEAVVVLGTGSYGNPAMLIVDAEIEAGPTSIGLGMSTPEATWWGGATPGGRVSTAAESGVNVPADVNYVTSIYGSYVRWDTLKNEQPGASYTLSVRREDFGGSTATLDFIVETVPRQQTHPYCVFPSGTRLGAQPSSTVMTSVSVSPASATVELVAPTASVTLSGGAL